MGVLDERRRVEEAYATLGKLRSELKREEVRDAPEIWEMPRCNALARTSWLSRVEMIMPV